MSIDVAIKPVEPLVRRGLFDSSESAILELTESYVLRQIQRFQEVITRLETKYGLTYQQFNYYLQQRSALLDSGELSPEQARSLGQEIMAEEEDALEWKIAQEMLQSWLGLRREVVR